jgi:hypothetical protein
MSAALVERVAEIPVTSGQRSPSLLPASVPSDADKRSLADPHPLAPVLVMGVISLAGALAFIGIIMAWLALRPTGLNAPW